MKLPEVNRELLPLKIVLFCLFGAHACLVPYMSIHMKSLGISVEETAFIYTFLPFTQIIGPPLAGIIADKMGRYKPILVVSLISTAVFSTSIMFVPPVSTVHQYSLNKYVMCDSTNNSYLVIEKCGENQCDNEQLNTTYQFILYDCQVSSCYANTPYYFNHTLTGTVVDAQLGEANIEEEGCVYPISSWHSFEHFCEMNKMYETRDNCTVKCNFALLTNSSHDKESNFLTRGCSYSSGNKQLTVWIYFILRIMFQIFVAICITLTDATTLTMVESHGGQYGRQRFWAILSTAIFSPITGFMVDLISKYKGYSDFSPAFHFFNGLTILTAVSVSLLKMEIARPEENMLKNVQKLFRLPVVIVLLFVIFWLGTVWGFIESFLFWYLEDLDSPKYLLGLTLTTGAIIGLPFLHESEWFVRKVGQVNLLILALFVYFIRCFGYSFIYNPWWCIPFEAMEAFTYHLMWVAAATYSASLCPKSLLATMQGCVGGIHYGVGRGSGSLIGGNIMNSYGARIAFRAMGIISGGFCIIYALLHYCIIERFSKAEEKIKKAIELEISIAEDIPPEEDPLSGEGGMNDELKRYLAHARKSIESRGPVL